MRRHDDIKCSFCGRSRRDVNKLIAGIGNSYICSDCIEIASDMLYEYYHEEEFGRKPKSPRKIKEFLDQYVVGQERAKKIVAVAVYNHYKRVFLRTKTDVEIGKSNIIMIGPTGTGKTLIARTVAKVLDVPFVVVDVTSYTEAGYVGEDVENILYDLYVAAGHDLEATQRGIVYMDEIDKLARKTGDIHSHFKDVSGEGVQQALLKIIEGMHINVPIRGARRNPYADYIRMDTSNILFIAGGAFEGLSDIISRRLKKTSLGFISETERGDSGNILKHVRPEDIVKYGMIPELVGRLPVIATVDPLSENDFYTILIKPRNAIVKQYQMLFEMDGVKLTFTEGALRTVAKEASERGIGARGLRAVMDELMLDIMYEVPGNEGITEVIIDEDVVKQKKTPIYIYRDAKRYEM